MNNHGPALVPEFFGDLERLDMDIVPPGQFVARLMQRAMMVATQWHGELVADFETQGSRLRKPQVMRIRRLTSTNETWVRGNKPQMALVTKAFGRRNRQDAFIDPSRR